MDRYLTEHYKGKYRVYAHYDLDTFDYPRDSEGNIDSSFGDFYLLGANKIEVKHGNGSILACYVPSTARGYNVLRSYYVAVFGIEEKDIDIVISQLKKDGYIENCDLLDGEVLFEFNAKHLDTIAKIVKLKTYGASISPFSTRNLPKSNYRVPPHDLAEYKSLVKKMQGFEVLALTRRFVSDILKIQDWKSELKKERLKANQYFHKNGYWSQWLAFIKENGTDNEKM